MAKTLQGDFLKTMLELLKMKNALLSLYDKTGSEDFAAKLVELGFRIISSGGTAKYLRDKGVEVTEVEEITGSPPVLNHRVVTLAKEIHGGLLATPDMLPELEELGWQKIDLLYVTFYPLEEELNREGATFQSKLEKTDIGGPAMIRSANKGGTTIPMISKDQESYVLSMLDEEVIDLNKLYQLRAIAEKHVADYTLLSAKVYAYPFPG